MSSFKDWIKKRNMTKAGLSWYLFKPIATKWFMRPFLGSAQRRELVSSGDPVRYGTILLAIRKIKEMQIPGAIAECGVYKGSLSRFLHDHLPERTFYLFDTFQGFDERDSAARDDARFRDTSVEAVLKRIGDTDNIVVRKGYFPETASGLEDQQFAFVMIDFDKYEPTRAALEFFYHRTASRGFIFIHDVNSPESDWACSRALDEFLADKLEKAIDIPDAWGSAVFRKM